MKKVKKTGAPCNKCGKPISNKILVIIDGPCHTCGETMKVAYIMSSDFGMIRGHMRVPVSVFNAEEIEIAKAKGVLLEVHYSETKQQSYLADICGHCNDFSGESFLFDEYVMPANNGELASQEFNIGIICENCER